MLFKKYYKNPSENTCRVRRHSCPYPIKGLRENCHQGVSRLHLKWLLSVFPTAPSKPSSLQSYFCTSLQGEFLLDGCPCYPISHGQSSAVPCKEDHPSEGRPLYKTCLTPLSMDTHYTRSSRATLTPGSHPKWPQTKCPPSCHTHYPFLNNTENRLGTANHTIFFSECFQHQHVLYTQRFCYFTGLTLQSSTPKRPHPACVGNQCWQTDGGLVKGGVDM